VPHRKKLTSEALRRAHSLYTANTPYLPLPHNRSPEGATTDYLSTPRGWKAELA